jgi:hypothetical protein
MYTGSYHHAARRAAAALATPDAVVMILSYALADLSVKTAVRPGPQVVSLRNQPKGRAARRLHALSCR